MKYRKERNGWKTNAKEHLDKLDDKDNPPTDSKDQEIVLGSAKLVITSSALSSSLPNHKLPVFHGDPCEWLNCYGMFKAPSLEQAWLMQG